MSKSKGTTGQSKGPTFEQALARLEKIVEKLDDGNLPLDESIELFKEGTQLAKVCRDKLAEADVQVKDALASAGADENGDEDELADEEEE